jgi:hypothetical protein
LHIQARVAYEPLQKVKAFYESHKNSVDKNIVKINNLFLNNVWKPWGHAVEKDSMHPLYKSNIQ